MPSSSLNSTRREIRRSVQRIDLLLQDGAYEEALERCEQLVEQDPQNPKLLGRLGIAHSLASRKDRAFYYFGRAAQAFATLSDAMGARVMLLEADRLRPNDPTILYLLSKCLRHEKRTADYISTLRRLVRATRESQDGHESWALDELRRLGQEVSLVVKAQPAPNQENAPHHDASAVAVTEAPLSADEDSSEVEVTVREAAFHSCGE